MPQQQERKGPRGGVLFDLDGTLLDTAPDFARVLNRLLAEHDRSALPFPRIRATVSDGARALVTLGFELAEDDAGFEPLRQRLLNYYEEGIAEQTRPFDGIPSLLRYLAAENLPWGIVTNKPSRFTDRLLQKLDLQPPPSAVICPDHVAKTKPDPESLQLACRHMGVDVGQCLYIGDHRRDIEAGRRAGMATVAVRWGYFDPQERIEDWGATHCVAGVGELQDLVRMRFLDDGAGT